MKIANVKVDTCWDCPYHECRLDAMYCSKLRKKSGCVACDNGENPIPKWCPLPNAEQVNEQPAILQQPQPKMPRQN